MQTLRPPFRDSGARHAAEMPCFACSDGRPRPDCLRGSTYPGFPGSRLPNEGRIELIAGRGTTRAISPNYTFLPQRDAILAQLGTLAEHHFTHDPNARLVKLRQFGEITAQRAAAHTGIFV